MKTFPMFLRTTNRRIVIVGGGEPAAQKIRIALKTDAVVVVAAETLCPDIAESARSGRVVHYAGPIERSLFEDAVLTFIATGCGETDASVAEMARGTGTVVNVVDTPGLCDAFTPSIVDRDPVIVAIGTEGTAPVLARMIRTRIEEMLEPRLGRLARFAGRMRDHVARRIEPAHRGAFWRWVFEDLPRHLHARGAESSAQKAIMDSIAAGGKIPTERCGTVSFVGAGPGAGDLTTVRAVQRLQEADVIFHDRLIGDGALEYARRDAERVNVGKSPGHHVWPQERINAALVAAARAGKRVVRLKCGDPGVFGRLAEETAALDRFAIPWEIVPGVTSASVAAAALGRGLTERGETDTLVLTTGHMRAGARLPDWGGQLRPGTSLAIYMGTANAELIRQQLLNAGHDTCLPVEIVCDAGSPKQNVVTSTLGGLGRTLKTGGIVPPAIILIRRPRTDLPEETREDVVSLSPSILAGSGDEARWMRSSTSYCDPYRVGRPLSIPNPDLQ